MAFPWISYNPYLWPMFGDMVVRPSKINSLFLVPLFWKTGEGGPFYFLFLNFYFTKKWCPCICAILRREVLFIFYFVTGTYQQACNHKHIFNLLSTLFFVLKGSIFCIPYKGHIDTALCVKPNCKYKQLFGGLSHTLCLLLYLIINIQKWPSKAIILTFISIILMN